MKVNKPDPSRAQSAVKQALYIGSRQKALPTYVSQQLNLSKLTKELSVSMNRFLGLKENIPLTIDTLNKVQGKFWSGQTDIQEKFCLQLWEIVKPLVEKYLREHPSKEFRNNGDKSKLRPVVFSPWEGLDVVIELKKEKNRLIPNSLHVNAGGSSINVARALSMLGTNFELVGLLGNSSIGKMVAKALETEGINPKELIPSNRDSKLHLSTPINHNEYWLVSQKEETSVEDLDNLTDKLFVACKKNEKEILSLGVRPLPGAPENYMSEITKTSQDKYGMFAIYDPKLKTISKEYFESVLQAGPSMIKPNIFELAQVIDSDPKTLREDKGSIVHAAQELIKKYDMKMVLVSMDKDGALLVDKKRAAYAVAPPIKVASPGCAGDTGIAAIIDRSKQQNILLTKLTNNQMKDLVSAFVAGGAATAMKPGSNIATLEEVQKLEKEVKVKLL